MRLAPALCCVVLLSACDRGGDLVRDDVAVEPAASRLVDGRPAFVGRWASRKAMCARQSWTLTTEAMTGPQGTTCAISQLTPTMAGYTVNAACSQGGARTPGRLVLTLSGGSPPTSLTIGGGPFAEPAPLVRCPA